MDEGPHVEREALAKAGYTGPLGTAVFCVILVVIGTLFGSVVFAMLLGAAMPELSDMAQTGLGSALGAALGIAIGIFKVRRGNLEAREDVEDKEWRRHIRRQLGRNDGG